MFLEYFKYLTYKLNLILDVMKRIYNILENISFYDLIKCDEIYLAN